MERKKILSIMLAATGLVLFLGGSSVYLARSGVVACEACGMEVEKSDLSTLAMTTSDGVTRYACCPMCGLMIGIYHKDAAVAGKCFACGERIKINISGGQMSDFTPVGPRYNVSIVLGNSCVTRKIVCSSACAQATKASKDWARELPVLPLATAFQRARESVPRFTIAPRQVSIPGMSYILIGLGVTLIVLSGVSYRLFNKRPAAS